MSGRATVRLSFAQQSQNRMHLISLVGDSMTLVVATTKTLPPQHAVAMVWSNLTATLAFCELFMVTQTEN